MKIGFIGQGYVGKSYADDYETRGYTIVRYSQEEPYIQNKDQLRHADIVFVAVPTPTKNNVFDDSVIRSVLPLVSKGSSVVIKSTLLPGTTNALQDAYPELYIFHSPEFLSEKTALEDARFPRRNIIGIPRDEPEYRARAEVILSTLPAAPFQLVCSATEAELIKYANNTFLYTKVVYMNALYDLVEAHGASWDHVRTAMAHEPWIGPMHLEPIHKSGRGAGGHCFIKDFAAFRGHYAATLPNDSTGHAFLSGVETKNIELLKKTNKDLELLRGVYGDEVLT